MPRRSETPLLRSKASKLLLLGLLLVGCTTRREHETPSHNAIDPSVTSQMHLDPGHLLTFGELKSILGSDVHPRLEIVNDPIKHEQKLVENLSVVDWGGGWFEGGMVTANF